MDLIYFSQFSEENFNLAKIIAENSNSICGMWNIVFCENDYFSSISLDAKDEVIDRIFGIKSFPQDEFFIGEMRDILTEAKFKPEAIICRGKTTELYALAALKNIFQISTKYVAILDEIPEFDDFDIRVLDAFDLIIIFQPLGKEFSFAQENNVEKKTNLFSRWESLSEFNLNNFNKIDFYIPENNSVLIVCNDQNYQELSNYIKKNISLISISAPEKELNIFLNISSNIVDLTECEEFKLILKKLGRKSISFKELEANNFNIIRENDFFESKGLEKEFCEFLYKGIVEHIGNIEKELSVECFEFRLEEN